MIAGLLPSMVRTAETFADLPGETPFPGEKDLVANAVPGRRSEFMTARRCARLALADLGCPTGPIRPGPRREPTWPVGVIGSITHCAGYRAAAVAWRGALAGLGIDAEPNAAVPVEVAELATRPDERDMLAQLAESTPATHWDRLLFSAKESVYKAWYPLTGRWLGFEDAVLTIDPVASRFQARILIDGARTDGGVPLTELDGRFMIARGLVLTAVSVAA